MNYRRVLLMCAAALISACGGRTSTDHPAQIQQTDVNIRSESVPTGPVAPVEKATPVTPTQGGMTLGPALALAQGLAFGVTTPLTSLTYRIANHGSTVLPVNLSVLPPEQAGTGMWELGYEPLPDPAWCVLSPTVITLAPGEEREVAISVHIPDDTVWANRRFVACVTLRAGAGSGQSAGAGLALAARLLLETTGSSAASAGAQTVPSLVHDHLSRGAHNDVTILVRRPADGTPLVCQRLRDLEPQAVRRDRYRTPDSAEAPVEMVQVEIPVFANGAGDWQPVTLHVTAPARRDSIVWEELFIVGSASELALAADPARPRQPAVSLIRYVLQISPDKAP